VSPPRRRRIALALGIAGALLRLGQYLLRGSLWLDEAAIARNVVGRSPSALLHPLDYAQIAPKGFLLVEKLAVGVFGANDYALRLYSLLAALAALPLFYALARRTLSESGALLAFAFFALLSRPIYYASEAKQYSGDIFAACLLLLLGLRVLSPESAPRHWLRLGVLGAIAVWFSQPALFVLVGIGLALAIAVVQRRIPLRWPAIVACMLWMASGLPSIWITLHSLGPAEYAYMKSFWREGFWPIVPHSLHDAAWPFLNLYGLFRDVLGMPLAVLGLGLFVIGVVWLARHRPVTVAALAGPILVLYAASALGVFPFATTLQGFDKISAGNGRVLMFLVPSLVLLVSGGIMALLDAPLLRVRWAGLVAAAVVIGAPLYYDVTELPYSPNGLWSAYVAGINRNRKPGDRLYVYYAGLHPFEWDRPHPLIPDDHVVRGGCYRPAWREYLRELDAFRGTGRVWVLIIHPSWVNGVHEGAVIEQYLDRVAPNLGRWGPNDAYALLYDFSQVPPLRGPPSAWHPPPRALPQDTVPLGMSCAGIYPAWGASRKR
jgi:hypothetical protein